MSGDRKAFDQWIMPLVQLASIPWFMGLIIIALHQRGKINHTLDSIIWVWNENPIYLGLVLCVIGGLLLLVEFYRSLNHEGGRAWLDQTFSWNYVHFQVCAYLLYPQAQNTWMYVLTVMQILDAVLTGPYSAYRATRYINVNQGSSLFGNINISPPVKVLLSQPWHFICFGIWIFDRYQQQQNSQYNSILNGEFLGADLMVWLLFVVCILSILKVISLFAVRGPWSYYAQVLDQSVITGVLVLLIQVPALNVTMFWMFWVLMYLVANLNGPITEAALHRVLYTS